MIPASEPGHFGAKPAAAQRSIDPVWTVAAIASLALACGLFAFCLSIGAARDQRAYHIERV